MKQIVIFQETITINCASLSIPFYCFIFFYKCLFTCLFIGTLDGLRRGQIEIVLRTKEKKGPSVFVDVSIENGDVSGICRSVNDPHILTFDGL